MARTDDSARQEDPSRSERAEVVNRRDPRPFWVAAGLVAALAVVGVVLLIAALLDEDLDPDEGLTDDRPTDIEAVPDGPIEGLLHWQAELGATTFPAVAHPDLDLVLLGNDSRPGVDEPSELVALRYATGRELWRTTQLQPVVIPAGITGNVAIARAIEDDNSPTDVVAFDVETGKELWRHTSTPMTPAPAVLEGAVLIGGEDLRALDPATSREGWRVDVPAEQTPTVDDGVAYVVAPGQIAAVDLDEGDIRWVHETGDVASFAAPAVLTDDLVVAANRLGEIRAVDRESGEQVYEVLVDPRDADAEGDGVLGLFGPEEGRIYAGTETGLLVALDAATGERLWDRPTSLDMSEPVVDLAGDHVALGGDTSDETVVLDAATGTERWRENTGATVPPVFVEDVVVTLQVRVLDQAHDVVAREPETGREVWRVELEHPAFGSVVRSEGLLLVATAERGAGTDTVYAVR